VKLHFWLRSRAVLTCATVALVLVGVGGAIDVSGASSSAASSSVSFLDPSGDAGSSLDITGLEVSSDWGGFGFWVTVAKNPIWCRGEGGDLPITVAIDTDQNPDTGSAFYGTEVEFAFQPPSNARDGEPVFRRANGWDFRGASLPGGFGWGCGPTGGGYFVDASALGVAPNAGFNVVAATVSPHTDTAPDIRTFNYQPVAGTPPPTLGPDTRAPHVVTYPSRAVHGKVARLTYWMLDGRGRTAETIRIYRRARLLKTIRRPLSDSNPFVLSHIAWRVPRTVRGALRFSVRSVDAAGNASKVSWARLVIR
jgi:hypothetical protein